METASAHNLLCRQAAPSHHHTRTRSIHRGRLPALIAESSRKAHHNPHRTPSKLITRCGGSSQHEPNFAFLGGVFGGKKPAEIDVPPPPPPLPTTEKYTVKRGDWLSYVAKDRGISFEELEALNPGVNLDYVLPGDVITVPIRPGSFVAAGLDTAVKAVNVEVKKEIKQVAEARVANQPNSDTYTVRSGDYLSGIAERQGITTRELLDLNPQLNYYSDLYVGEQIKIPYVAPAPVCPPPPPRSVNNTHGVDLLGFTKTETFAIVTTLGQVIQIFAIFWWVQRRKTVALERDEGYYVPFSLINPIHATLAGDRPFVRTRGPAQERLLVESYKVFKAIFPIPYVFNVAESVVGKVVQAVGPTVKAVASSVSSTVVSLPKKSANDNNGNGVETKLETPPRPAPKAAPALQTAAAAPRTTTTAKPPPVVTPTPQQTQSQQDSLTSASKPKLAAEVVAKALFAGMSDVMPLSYGYSAKRNLSDAVMEACSVAAFKLERASPSLAFIAGDAVTAVEPTRQLPNDMLASARAALPDSCEVCGVSTSTSSSGDVNPTSSSSSNNSNGTAGVSVLLFGTAGSLLFASEAAEQYGVNSIVAAAARAAGRAMHEQAKGRPLKAVVFCAPVGSDAAAIEALKKDFPNLPVYGVTAISMDEEEDHSTGSSSHQQQQASWNVVSNNAVHTLPGISVFGVAADAPFSAATFATVVGQFLFGRSSYVRAAPPSAPALTTA